MSLELNRRKVLQLSAVALTSVTSTPGFGAETTTASRRPKHPLTLDVEGKYSFQSGFELWVTNGPAPVCVTAGSPLTPELRAQTMVCVDEQTLEIEIHEPGHADRAYRLGIGHHVLSIAGVRLTLNVRAGDYRFINEPTPNPRP